VAGVSSQWRCAGLLLLLAPLASAQHEAAHAAPKAAAGAAPGAAGSPAPPKSGPLTDAQAAELAKSILNAESPTAIRETLNRLKGHNFKSSKVPEREMVLYAQGVIEARLGNLGAASLALKKLEKQWPKSPFMGEAQSILAEYAVEQKHYKEAETRLHQALSSDMPSERKRRPQELLIWTLVEQGRAQEAVTIVQSLQPLEGKDRPSEKGLSAIVEVLASTGEKAEAEAARKDFLKLYPDSAQGARVELAWGRLLGRGGDAKGAAEVFRKLIKTYPRAPQADDAKLALANLLTDGSLPDTKGLASAESLLAEVRKNGKALPNGTAQLVELRLLAGKSLWEEVLARVDRMDAAQRDSQPEVKKLWTEAWVAWVDQRLEKGFPGELLTRLKPGTYGALGAKARLGIAELFAVHGLLEVLPALIAEAPTPERGALRKAALAKTQAEAQPRAVLKLLPAKGDSPDEALMRAQAEAALENWASVRGALPRAKPGAERMKVLLHLLQRPLATKETAAQRLVEAQGWLGRVTEKAELREPLTILVGDLRLQCGDAKGALAMYPPKAAAPDQRGWVVLMRAQAMVKLGQREEARLLMKGAREEQGFKGQRDALAKSLGAY